MVMLIFFIVQIFSALLRQFLYWVIQQDGEKFKNILSNFYSTVLLADQKLEMPKGILNLKQSHISEKLLLKTIAFLFRYDLFWPGTEFKKLKDFLILWF